VPPLQPATPILSALNRLKIKKYHAYVDTLKCKRQNSKFSPLKCRPCKVPPRAAALLRPLPAATLCGNPRAKPLPQAEIKIRKLNSCTSTTSAQFHNTPDSTYNKECAWRHNIPPPLSFPVGALAPRAPPCRRNVAVLSPAEYVPTLTAAAALRVKAALSKAAW